MGLLDLLLAEPSAADKALSVLTMMGGGQRPSGLPSGQGGGSTVPGRGIFGNDTVDVLGPDDPRLRSVGGTTLARPAARSIIDVLRSLGIPVDDIGGGYRTPEQQAALRASKPGLAAPEGSSFHQEGLAIDLAAALQNDRVFNALRNAGWNQLAGEPWHWSYGVSG